MIKNNLDMRNEMISLLKKSGIKYKLNKSGKVKIKKSSDRSSGFFLDCDYENRTFTAVKQFNLKINLDNKDILLDALNRVNRKLARGKFYLTGIGKLVFASELWYDCSLDEEHDLKFGESFSADMIYMCGYSINDAVSSAMRTFRLVNKEGKYF